MSYDKLYPIFEAVCLARIDGPANPAVRIRNCLRRSMNYWKQDYERWEEYFVRIIMTGEYKKEDFIRSCRCFGEKSVEILDAVRQIASEWNDQ